LFGRVGGLSEDLNRFIIAHVDLFLVIINMEEKCFDGGLV
jgi:hypothetical protein